MQTPTFFGDKPVPAQQGELGKLSKERPSEPGHPLPRVIVDVRGGKHAPKVEAAARAALCGKVVACYGKEAYKDATLKVDASFSISVHSEKVAAASVGARKKGAPAASVAQGSVASCIAAAAKGESAVGGETSESTA